jgi:hypothetical protein
VGGGSLLFFLGICMMVSWTRRSSATCICTRNQAGKQPIKQGTNQAGRQFLVWQWILTHLMSPSLSSNTRNW